MNKAKISNPESALETQRWEGDVLQSKRFVFKGTSGHFDLGFETDFFFRIVSSISGKKKRMQRT